MENADEISDKPHREKTLTNSVNDVRTVVKNRTCETNNLESVSSSYSSLSENAGSKVNMTTSHTNKSNDPSGLECHDDEPNMLSVVFQSEFFSRHSGFIENRSSELLDRDVDNMGCDVEKSSHDSDDQENSKFSLNNQKEIATDNQKKVGTNNGGGNLPKETSRSPGHVEEEDVPAILNVKDSSVDGSDESGPVLHDVKVCDICGDAGREDLLAICCRCIDGAEHTYCMKELMDRVPEGDWLCEECKLDEENRNTSRQRYGTEAGAKKAQSSGPAVEEPRKVSSKRRAEESESSSAVKKRALEVTDSSTKVKSSYRFSSDSLFGDESSEDARSPATRPRLQSLRGAFTKSSSFNIPNARSKTKLVDEIVLQRQKSTKERSSHDTSVAREMGKSMSFKSTNLSRFGSNGSKVKLLSPKSSHVQDLKSPKNKKERNFERNFERNSSVKSPSTGNLSTLGSTALTPKVDKSLVSRAETTPVSSTCNSEVKPSKGDSKMIAGLKSTTRSANIGAEASVSLVNKQSPSSPFGIGTSSSSGIISSTEQKSALKEDNSTKLPISKQSTHLGDGIKETTNTSHLKPGLIPGHIHTADRPGSAGPKASAMRSSNEGKNRDNKLKDAIEAALLKKPGIYRKNRVSDQPDEASVSSMNNEAAFVDRIPHSRNAGNLTSTEALTDWQGQISLNSTTDHSKQSNGKHPTTELSTHDAVALSSPSKIPFIPDYEYIWQGSFEISKSGKTAEFWDGLQAHLSTCASPKVFEAVNNLPHKILLNGVSRTSAWPEQFENNGAKEDNIALYFFAKDVESYEKSYQVLLDDMMRGDLALIGSIDGVELLIFPSNQLPEKSHRWNMLFFLWGVFRGKKKNSVHQVPDHPEKNCIPQVTSFVSTDKISSAEDVCSLGSVDKDRHVDSDSKGNLKLQIFTQEKAINSISIPHDSDNVVPANSSVPNKNDNKVVKYSRNLKAEQGSKPSVTEVTSKKLNHLQVEPNKRTFIDLEQGSSVTEVPAKDLHHLPLEPNKRPFIDLEQGSSVTEVPAKDLNHLQPEPNKRPFIDLSEDVGFNDTNEINTWRDPVSQMAEEGSVNKKQKSDSGKNFNQHEPEESGAGHSNEEKHLFPVDPAREVKDVHLGESGVPSISSRTPKYKLALDLNEDISSCLVGDTDDAMMMIKEEDVSSSLSLSLSFSHVDKDDKDRAKSNHHPTPSMLIFRDIVDK